jgi:hypothetical protein
MSGAESNLIMPVGAPVGAEASGAAPVGAEAPAGAQADQKTPSQIRVEAALAAKATAPSQAKPPVAPLQAEQKTPSQIRVDAALAGKAAQPLPGNQRVAQAKAAAPPAAAPPAAAPPAAAAPVAKAAIKPALALGPAPSEQALAKADKKILAAVEGVKHIPEKVTEVVTTVKEAAKETAATAISMVANPDQYKLDLSPKVDAMTDTANEKADPSKKKDVILEDDLFVRTFEEDHPFEAQLVGLSLSQADKERVLINPARPYISGQLNTRKLRLLIRIFTGIEVYDLSVKDKGDISMYDVGKFINEQDTVFLNSEPTETVRQPELNKTLSEFNENYLKWMDVEDIGPEKRRMRKRDMKNLFIFIFNGGTINDISTSFAKKLWRIAHTELSIEDKIPCDGLLFKDFLRSLQFRLKSVKEELLVARKVFGTGTALAANQYVEQKRALYIGLNDLVQLLEGGDLYARPCISYSYGDKNDYVSIMDRAEQNRIMRIFIKFIKKEDGKYKEPLELRQYMHDKEEFPGISLDNDPEMFDKLYKQLVDILEQLRKQGQDTDVLKAALTEKEMMIVALHSLLQISTQITSLNEAYITLQDRYQRAESKAYSEKLLGQYKKFRAVLNEMVVTKSRSQIIEAADRVTEVLIQFSGVNYICGEKYSALIAELESIKEVVKGARVEEDIKGRVSQLAGDAIEMLKEKSAGCGAEAAAAEAAAAAPQTGGSLGGPVQGKKMTPRSKVKALFNYPDANEDTKTQTYCDTLLALLLLDMKRSREDFDVEEFMKKMEISVRGLEEKPCPALLHKLKMLIDGGLEQDVKEDAYMFSPLAAEAGAEAETEAEAEAEKEPNLEQIYADNFSQEEKTALENLTPIRYYSQTPPEYQDLLGKSPYFLSGHSDQENPELYGLGDDLPVHMTAEDKEVMTRRGIPMGAILIMYGTAISHKKGGGIISTLHSEPSVE